MRGRGRARGRAARGRRGGISRGRGKKNVKVIESDEEEVVTQQEVLVENHQDENFPPVKIDLEADISQLEAPIFTTINRGPPEPMLRLRWDHRVSLIGEKVLDPMIHCCELCLKPILIYGRMIPCKHVFCLGCSRHEDKSCPKCHDSVNRVEQTGLGTVFMCTYGGSRYGTSGCRRTYLSQRDLQAHVNHRHSVGGDASPNKGSAPPPPGPPQPRKIPPAPSQNDPRTDGSSVQYRSQSRTNLITVPIQQDPPTPHYHQTQTVEANNYMNAAQYGNYNNAGYYQQYPPPPPPYQDTQYWPMHQFYR